MRIAGIFCILVGVAAAFVAGRYSEGLELTQLCEPGEACAREWLSATSGWAAVLAAVLTILYLHKQIRDTDRHQRTDFAIQLRKQRILATRTGAIARVALEEIEKQERANPEAEIGSWDRVTVGEILHHLRDSTISTFEGEVAHPMGMGAWGTALAVESGYNGTEPASITAPGLARQYFEDVRDQADAFLAEVSKITRKGA